MNPGMKMMLMNEAAGRNRDNQYNGTYNVDIGYYNGGSEMRRRRDSRGRYMESDNDTEMRYRNEDSRMEYDSPESRFRDRRGREHYDNGRYAPTRNMMDIPYNPYAPKQIGFSMMGESQQQDEMQMGMSEGKHMDLDQMSAEQWMRNMEKEDGSKGPKWTKEQVKPYMAQVGYHGPEYKFWAVMNALYSDYCKIAKKYGVDRPEYYAELTKAWLEDKDAVPEKAGLYYKYIVEH